MFYHGDSFKTVQTIWWGAELYIYICIFFVKLVLPRHSIRALREIKENNGQEIDF